VKFKLAGVILAAAFALSIGASKADDVAANLRLMAFGSEAQLTAVTHAIERFNKKYPNVKVEVAIDPITNGWGDYVTHVLSQFNANNAYHSTISLQRRQAILTSIPRSSNIRPIRARPISSRSDGTTS
jgi:ABC-type glycerol-3-phosphate transport system substrate-binding protein